MKKCLVLCSLTLFVFYFGITVHATTPVKVDVLYMNHGPLMDTLKKVKDVFSGYGNALTISWHDVDTEDGEQFMKKMNLKGHIPLIIWIDGTPKVTLGVKEISFAGFPTGSGPAFFQGKWTLDDLKAALNQATGKK
jgi:hypothetical protein